MSIYTLANNEAAQGGFTKLATFTYEALQRIGTGNTVTLAELSPGAFVEVVTVTEAERFAGTSTLVIDVGTTVADPDEFIDALDVDAMGASVVNTGESFTDNQSQLIPVGNGTTSQKVYLKVTDANLAAASAGKLVIAMRIFEPARFA